ncbi:MAG: hypothetical protein R3C28_07060 [Pirellulaceae bacterium]
MPGQLINDDGELQVGIGEDAYDILQTDLNPEQHSVIIQLDTFDSQLRAWAWRPGEEPTTEEAMVEGSLATVRGAPAIWTRDFDGNDGGTSTAVFRWFEFSDQHIPIVVAPTILGDFNNDGLLDITDINLLTAATAAASADLDFDLNADGAVNQADIGVWVHDLRNTWIGDANLDGQFASEDFVDAFVAGKYEQNIPADWSEGDWNGDGRFSSGDFVAAHHRRRLRTQASWCRRGGSGTEWLGERACPAFFMATCRR